MTPLSSNILVNNLAYHRISIAIKLLKCKCEGNVAWLFCQFRVCIGTLTRTKVVGSMSIGLVQLVVFVHILTMADYVAF